MKAAVTAALIAAIAVTAAGCASTTHAVSPAAHPLPTLSTNPAGTYTNPATPAAATPSPAGKFHGTCDYTLSDSFSSADAGTLIGEVDLRNTGNIGTVERVRITWPQEGYPPVVATRTVRVPSGASRTVQFHVTATQSNIELLQSWQGSHDYADGCHYRATLIRPFGAVH